MNTGVSDELVRTFYQKFHDGRNNDRRLDEFCHEPISVLIPQ
jgi:hypothetical protein